LNIKTALLITLTGLRNAVIRVWIRIAGRTRSRDLPPQKPAMDEQSETLVFPPVKRLHSMRPESTQLFHQLMAPRPSEEHPSPLSFQGPPAISVATT